METICLYSLEGTEDWEIDAVVLFFKLIHSMRVQGGMDGLQ